MAKDRLEADTLIIEDESLKRGFVLLPKQILYARNLSRDAKILYSILLGYAWQERRCFPGYARLCDDMQASENMVRKYMRELIEVELISQRRRGLGKTNIYSMREIRTSKIEVQEPRKIEVAEPQQSEDYEETEYKKTEEQETDLSNIRMATQSERKRKPEEHSELSQKKESKTGFHSIGAALETHKPRSRLQVDTYDEDRQIILEYISDFAREFNDQASLKSSTTRAVNLFKRSSLSREDFISRLYEARALTKERTAAIRTTSKDSSHAFPTKHKMAYFFACLEERLGLREPKRGSPET